MSQSMLEALEIMVEACDRAGIEKLPVQHRNSFGGLSPHPADAKCALDIARAAIKAAKPKED